MKVQKWTEDRRSFFILLRHWITSLPTSNFQQHNDQRVFCAAYVQCIPYIHYLICLREERERSCEPSRKSDSEGRVALNWMT